MTADVGSESISSGSSLPPSPSLPVTLAFVAIELYAAATWVMGGMLAVLPRGLQQGVWPPMADVKKKNPLFILLEIGRIMQADKGYLRRAAPTRNRIVVIRAAFQFCRITTSRLGIVVATLVFDLNFGLYLYVDSGRK